MKLCCYTWKESMEGKVGSIRYRCTEEIWEGSEKYCIFHDPSQKKDVGLFRRELQKKFNRKDFDFRGYYFPEDMDFTCKEFDRDTYFDGATFKNVSFSDVIFKNVSSRSATFQNADFSNATFQNADFSKSFFHRADFSGATFQDANFKGVASPYMSFFYATIEQNLDLNTFQIDRLNLQNAKFFSKGHIATDLTHAKFYGAELESVFFDCKWPKKLHEEIHLIGEGLSFGELETIYRHLKQNMRLHGDHLKAGEFYYREMEMKRKQYELFTLKGLSQNILRILCGYGEKPSRVIAISLLIILLGAIPFFFCGITVVGDEPRIVKNKIDYNPRSLFLDEKIFLDFSYCIYYSAATFTIFSSGNIHPHGYGHIFATIEAFTGAFFMSLFVLVFGRKMMR